MAMAWQAEQGLLCGGCGLPRDETMAAANEEAYESEKWVCFACRARGHCAETASADDDATGVYYTVRRNDG